MCAVLATVMLVMTLYCAGIGSATADILQHVAPNLLGTAQSTVSQNLSPWIWNKLVAPALVWPVWTVPASFALIFGAAAIWPNLRARRARAMPGGVGGAVGADDVL